MPMVVMSWAVAFTVCGTAVLLVAAALAFLGIAHVRLSGQDAIERDGLATGRRAPAWSLTDEAGTVRTSPPSMPLQLVVFADHSLKSFPSVADGLRELPASGAPVEIVLLLRQPSPMAGPVLGRARPERRHGPDRLSPSLYGKYNVRVGPFLIFVDRDGLVRASSLVNHSWQVAKLYQLAEPAGRGGGQMTAPRARRQGGAGRSAASATAWRRELADPASFLQPQSSPLRAPARARTNPGRGPLLSQQPSSCSRASRRDHQLVLASRGLGEPSRAGAGMRVHRCRRHDRLRPLSRSPLPVFRCLDSA